ncbi:cytochrome P450 CYP749A22-like [Mercurialis annua]|uniref:cytochrome P450 CYP749A22-like n=1 Tax=Mercurialis annua TaxID=3986 RepID=UPI00215F6550|nr:cytochrome P450 CYP749A22-like [Mercurialis annua]
MIVLIWSWVFSCLAFTFLVKFLYDVWLNPIRIQSALRSQGIRGPSYRFIYGNSRDLVKLRDEALRSSTELSSHQILRRVQPDIYLWTKLHGKNYVSWIGTRPQLFVTEPNLIKEALCNKDEAYQKPEFESYVKHMFGDGLGTTQGEKWHRQRKLANHAFHGDSLKGMIPAMILNVEIMLKRWRQNEADKEIEVYQEFKLLTSEIISRTAFGSSYIEGQQIFDMLGRLTLILNRNNYRVGIRVLEKFWKTRDEIESEKLEQGIRDSVLAMIKKREESEVKSSGSDYFGVLMKAYKETDKTKKITIQDIIDECKTFYIAGHETTSSLLTWCMFLLAIHSDWQQKARQEVIGLLGQQNPTSDDLTRLKIMTMIVNETLRLYPPITNLIREVKKGSRLGKLLAPATLDLFIPPLVMHQDPQIWGEDAHLFKPERFAEGIAKATKNNITAFVPFGLGPRNCVGMNFALAETKIALCMILQRYSFSLSSNYVHSPTLAIGLYPQKGLQINLQTL